jgi:peroxiredoxin
MKHILSTIVFFGTICFAWGQSSTLTIKMKEKEAPLSAYVYLNQGSTLIPVDSIKLGKGTFTFKTKNYKPGIYSFVLSEDTFARIIVNNEDVEVSTSLESLPDSLQVIKSEENRVYYSFLRAREAYNKKIEAITTLLKFYPSKGKMNRVLLKEKRAIENSYSGTIRSLINSKGDLLASKIILAELPVKAPENLTEEEKRQYLISNWWSSFPFESANIINTPSVSDKLWDYIDLFYVDGASREDQANYFKRAVDEVMNQPGISQEVQAFFKTELIKTFSQSSYDGIIEYIKKNYPLKSGPEQNFLDSEFEQLISLTTGKPAPDFTIESSNLKAKLSELSNNGTILIFWSMECSHCRKMLPALARNYKTIKELGFDVVAINLDAYKPAWKAFIKSNGYEWIDMNIQNPFNSPITSAYHVTGTPIIYIIDKNKTIYDKPSDVKTILKSVERLSDEQNKK